MSEAPAPTAINPGTPEFVGGKITFDGAVHPKSKEATTASNTAQTALDTKLEGIVDYKTAVAALPSDDKRNAAIEALQKKHAPEEHGTLTQAKAAQGKIENELRVAQGKHLNNKDTFIEGLTAGEERTKAVKAFHGETKALDRKATPTLLKNHFPIAREEGLGAAVSHNIGKEAWRKSKGRLAIRGAGVVLGVVLMGDALLRSNSGVDADGKPQSRGVLGRFTEAVVGAGVATTSALHGGR